MAHLIKKVRVDPLTVESPLRVKPGKRKKRRGVPEVMEPVYTQEQIVEIFQIFTVFDRRDHDMVTTKDFVYLIRLFGNNPTLAELKAILADKDPKKTGWIHFLTFLDVLAVYNDRIPLPDEELLEAFKYFDHSNENMLMMDELRKALMWFGERLTYEEANILCQTADPKNKGEFNFEDFFYAMEKKKKPGTEPEPKKKKK